MFMHRTFGEKGIFQRPCLREFLLTGPQSAHILEEDIQPLSMDRNCREHLCLTEEYRPLSMERTAESKYFWRDRLGHFLSTGTQSPRISGGRVLVTSYGPHCRAYVFLGKSLFVWLRWYWMWMCIPWTVYWNVMLFAIRNDRVYNVRDFHHGLWSLVDPSIMHAVRPWGNNVHVLFEHWTTQSITTSSLFTGTFSSWIHHFDFSIGRGYTLFEQYTYVVGSRHDRVQYGRVHEGQWSMMKTTHIIHTVIPDGKLQTTWHSNTPSIECTFTFNITSTIQTNSCPEIRELCSAVHRKLLALSLQKCVRSVFRSLESGRVRLFKNRCSLQFVP